ncbi:MAG TPA: amino acid adenylation domain-containing protein, partial [Candidatus Kapabacteria bacterium]|nr:amino acid adenylation domain-containing protein [Candidatus Kapabacteria bacterium]
KDSAASILLTNVEKEKTDNCQLPMSECHRRGFQHSAFDLPRAQHSNHLCYIIYTSGSTGKPKGVLTMHANVVRVVRNTNYIDIVPGDRILQLSNYAFDGSVFDIYGALLNGAALILINKENVSAANRLAEALLRDQITVFFVTTALFNVLVKLEQESLKNIRKILFGGERVSLEHVGKALEYLGKEKIIHVYGPTETTVYATYYFIDNIENNAVTIPIGKPISNTTVYILDKYLTPVTIGVPGEIYIGGPGVARGYLNNPELTAERFIKYRSYGSYKTYIHYKTGDLARWLPDGNIEFLGRIDHQVKLRGFRVELGEIENRLLKYPGIKGSLVLDREEKNGDKYLCAYIVSIHENIIPGLREYLAKELPGYMIPSYFVQLEKFPLTPNGKIDRKALPKPELKSGDSYIAPRDEIEKKLVEIWSNVLGRDELHAVQLETSIGIDDNFFQLGGHSLKATILVSKIHKLFQVNIPLTEIFKTPTIQELANYIKTSFKNKFVSIYPVEKRKYYPLSSAQKRLYILYQLEPQGVGYNIPFFSILEGEID